MRAPRAQAADGRAPRCRAHGREDPPARDGLGGRDDRHAGRRRAGEVGHEREAAPDRHQPVGGREVVGEVRDGGLEARGRGRRAARPVWQKEPWRPGDPRHVGMRGQVDGVAGRGCPARTARRIGSSRSGVRSSAGRRRSAGANGYFLREHEVELAELEQRDRVLGLELARADLELRVLAGEPPDRGRQQRPVGAREGGGAQHAGDGVLWRASAASAASSSRSTDSVRATSSRPAGVSRRLRPLRSSRSTPASRSSAASCWETAGGV